MLILLYYLTSIKPEVVSATTQFLRVFLVTVNGMANLVVLNKSIEEFSKLNEPSKEQKLIGKSDTSKEQKLIEKSDTKIDVVVFLKSIKKNIKNLSKRLDILHDDIRDDIQNLNNIIGKLHVDSESLHDKYEELKESLEGTKKGKGRQTRGFGN